jgi:hypothetical protein
MMDGRWPKEEEAGVMEVYPQIHHHHCHQLSSNYWRCKLNLCNNWCRTNRINQLLGHHHVISVANF